MIIINNLSFIFVCYFLSFLVGLTIERFRAWHELCGAIANGLFLENMFETFFSFLSMLAVLIASMLLFQKQDIISAYLFIIFSDCMAGAAFLSSNSEKGVLYGIDILVRIFGFGSILLSFVCALSSLSSSFMIEDIGPLALLSTNPELCLILIGVCLFKLGVPRFLETKELDFYGASEALTSLSRCFVVIARVFIVSTLATSLSILYGPFSFFGVAIGASVLIAGALLTGILKPARAFESVAFLWIASLILFFCAAAVRFIV